MESCAEPGWGEGEGDTVGEVEGLETVSTGAANPLSTSVKLAATTSAGATGVKRLETLAVSRALAYACRTPPRATCAVAVLAKLLWRAAAV
jgi:hypothetical protein